MMIHPLLSEIPNEILIILIKRIKSRYKMTYAGYTPPNKIRGRKLKALIFVLEKELKDRDDYCF